MKKSILYILLALAAMAVWGGCTDQRHLYVDIKPMFVIKNDWSASRLIPEGATAMLYGRSDPCELMHNSPHRHKLYLEPTLYDILVFNEVMFSPTASNIKGIVYRETEGFDTFGAYALPNPVNPIFRSEPSEVMVGYGYPEHLAAHTYVQKEVLEDKQYIMKYQNGKNGFPVYQHFDADSVEFLPIRLTRDVRVIAHVRNLKSEYRISGTLNGFAEGVLLANRQPDGADAAYVFDLNNAQLDPETKNSHIITSGSFTTFGPWWNDYPGNRRYMLSLVANCSGELLRYNFDVTERNADVIRSVGEAIVKIKDEEAKYIHDGTLPAMEEIIIEIQFDLPAIPDGSIEVDVGDWGQDIIIPVPIGI